MDAVLFSLIPMMIGSAIAPGVLSLNLVVLQSPNGVTRSSGFIIGATLLKLLQGLCFGYLFSAAAISIINRGRGSPITSTLFMFMGLMFLIMGIRAYFHAPDSDAPPPKWMNVIEHLTTKKLFVFGIVWAFASGKGWVFTLASLSIIHDANMDFVISAITYILYVTGCMAGFLIPLVLCVLAPDRANETLTRLDRWITRNHRLITIVISAFFGVVFLYRGIVGLLT